MTPKSEWLEADGLGGFASGTVSGIRTRRYHALLLAATAPPAGRMVLVNGFDAELETASGKLAMSTQRYAPGVDQPDGATRLLDFTLEPWPTWKYAFDGGSVVQEIFVPRGQATVVLRWRWEGETLSPLRLHIRPFFSGRDFHATHHENGGFRFEPVSRTGGERWQVYDGVPSVLARSSGSYQHEPCWYRHFLYEEEQERGLDATEDLASPGRYEFDLAAGPGVLIFSADVAASPQVPASLTASGWAEQLASAEKTRRGKFATPRLRAADAYLVKRGDGQTIIAGYPWFGDWGRDTFIAMRGLCLATGRLREARDILMAWAKTVSKGMLPNRFPDKGSGEPEYNSVDASLWYVIVVNEFLELTKSEPSLATAEGVLLEAVDAILLGYFLGTRFNIQADLDGLLSCGAPGVQLTWMDAKVGDWVVTPRIGKPVEVQALWLTALGLASRRDSRWQELYEEGCASFHDRFWNERLGCLYDVIDVDHRPGVYDDRVRPNQIFAVGGLPLMLLEGEQAERLVQTVEGKLWTPMGLRSLASGEHDYAPHYEGGPARRDAAYHQGTVWPWLTGAFVDAWVRVHGETPKVRAQARALYLEPQLARLDLPGLHHVPEIADGDLPYKARGCPFQAWSLGEVIRLEEQIL